MKNIRFLESIIKMPLMSLPVRSTLVHLDGKEILISPGSKIPRETYDPKWPITDIVASNLFHLAGVPKAASIYPQAQLWGVTGCPAKRGDIQWSKELHEESWPYQNDLPLVTLQGVTKINEVLFFHPNSRSLIVTDLCFNMKGIPGIGAWLILNLFGTYDQFAMSRFFARYVTDRKAFELSLQKVFSWDFDRIVVSHGQNIESNGKEILQNALFNRGFRIT